MPQWLEHSWIDSLPKVWDWVKTLLILAIFCLVIGGLVYGCGAWLRWIIH